MSEQIVTEIWVAVHENEGVVLHAFLTQQAALRAAEQFALGGLDRRTQIAKYVIEPQSIQSFGSLSADLEED